MSIKDTYLAKKSLIASNLTSKGVEADSSMGLTTLANKILLVEGGDNLYSGTTDVSVRAVWEDDNNSQSIRPNTLKVALIGSDGSYRSIQLNNSNSWQHTFTNIPQKYNNQNIVYTVDTHEISYYRLSISGTQTEGYVITNTLLTGNLTVGMDVEGFSPNSDTSGLSITIYGPDSRTPITIQLSQMINGRYELTDLLEGTYSVICSNFYLDDVYLLRSSILGRAVNVQYNSNTNAQIYLEYSYEEEEPLQEETRTITVQIIFDDNGNQDGNRPDSVTVYLYAGDAEADNVTIGEAEGWSHAFTDLPKYNNGGEEIYYTVQQSLVDLYTTTVNGYTITNTYVPQTTSAAVTKIWDDNYDEQGIRPDFIRMTLSNGDFVILNDTNNWAATVTNLPTVINKQPFTYTWTEEEVNGYIQSNRTTNGITTTFTNALVSYAPPGTKPK